MKKIKNETKANNVKILKLSNKIHRVYLGPFSNLNSLKKSHDDISILNFDNISNTTYGLAVIESDKLDKAIYADKIKMNKLEVLPMNMNFGEQ